jgi:hypothetical protein
MDGNTAAHLTSQPNSDANADPFPVAYPYADRNAAAHDDRNTCAYPRFAWNAELGRAGQMDRH